MFKSRTTGQVNLCKKRPNSSFTEGTRKELSSAVLPGTVSWITRRLIGTNMVYYWHNTAGWEWGAEKGPEGEMWMRQPIQHSYRCKGDKEKKSDRTSLRVSVQHRRPSSNSEKRQRIWQSYANSLQDRERTMGRRGAQLAGTITKWESYSLWTNHVPSNSLGHYNRSREM